MALTKGEKAALVIGGGLLSGLCVYYLKAGAGREKNAALIPDALEDRLDMVVEALNDRFGKRWLGLSTKALSSTVPAPLAALIELVVAAEQLGRKNGWDGEHKRAHAVRLAAA